VADVNLSTEAFPFGTSREIDIGYGRVRATRISYVGELGWELYVPSDMARHIFDVVTTAGAAFGLKLAGYHALNSLRIEKAYRHWGYDIGDEDTPLEAGLQFAVDWDTDFIGRDALLHHREKGVARMLVQFLLEDDSKLLYHNEPIWRDDAIAGYITSGMFGHTLGGAVGLGYVSEPGGGAVDAAFIDAGTFEIEVACERIPARASRRPMYDPLNVLVRA
jgi:4-methylaminobutanoate oxidase (formaldehyde-forming)